MSTSSIALARPRTGVLSRVADYIELTKPRIAVLVLVSVAAGAAVSSWGQPDPWLLAHTLLGTLLVAASASGFNQLLERNTDALMPRTQDRPLPAGRLSVLEVFAFSGICILAGIAYLLALVNVPAAAVAAATWLAYVVLYTPLKYRTAWNTHVGAVAGALPVLIGAAAVGGRWEPAIALFCILLLWQFPHFMAIAWLYREQYARAGMKMAPVVDATGRTAGLQAVLSALALLPLCLWAAVQFPPSQAATFMVVGLLLGAAQLAFAIAFCVNMNTTTARLLLRASLVYLPTLLLLLIALPLW
jgi:protoheme IX farnesyltransferase